MAQVQLQRYCQHDFVSRSSIQKGVLTLEFLISPYFPVFIEIFQLQLRKRIPQNILNGTVIRNENKSGVQHILHIYVCWGMRDKKGRNQESKGCLIIEDMNRKYWVDEFETGGGGK